MFNVSESTIIEGWEGKRSAIQQAITDKNLHEIPIYSYYGAHVQRGVMKAVLKGQLKTITFEAKNGWATKLKVE